MTRAPLRDTNGKRSSRCLKERVCSRSSLCRTLPRPTDANRRGYGRAGAGRDWFHESGDSCVSAPSHHDLPRKAKFTLDLCLMQKMLPGPFRGSRLESALGDSFGFSLRDELRLAELHRFDLKPC